MRYNRYGDDFLIDKIQPDEIGEELVKVGEVVAEEEWQILNDSKNSLQEDYRTGARSRPGTKRDRKKGKYKPEGTGMDA